MAEVPVPSTKKSNAGKKNFMSDAPGRRHEYRLAVEFISELLTDEVITIEEVCGGDRL
jgi:hypothetical protein